MRTTPARRIITFRVCYLIPWSPTKDHVIISRLMNENYTMRPTEETCTAPNIRRLLLILNNNRPNLPFTYTSLCDHRYQRLTFHTTSWITTSSTDKHKAKIKVHNLHPWLCPRLTLYPLHNEMLKAIETISTDNFAHTGCALVEYSKSHVDIL